MLRSCGTKCEAVLRSACQGFKIRGRLGIELQMAITYVVLGALPQSLTPQGQGQGEAAAEQGRVEEGREKERNGGSLVSHYAALSLSLSLRVAKRKKMSTKCLYM